MRIEDISTAPTAIVTVKVFPIGQPGQVLITVESEGSAGLNDDEIGVVLRQAADSLTPGPDPA